MQVHVKPQWSSIDFVILCELTVVSQRCPLEFALVLEPKITLPLHRRL